MKLPLRWLRLSVRPTIIVSALATLVSTLACSGSTNTSPAALGGRLGVAAPILGPGDTAKSEALRYSASGVPQADVTAAATWTSANTMVATVDPDGTTHGIAPGRTTIQASYQGLTGTTEVTIFAPSDLLDVFFAGSSQVRLPVGGAIDLELRATLGIPHGATLFEVTPRATYRLTNPQLLRMDSPGRFTALGPGFSNVIATYQGRTITESVFALPPSQPGPNTVTLPQFGGALSGQLRVGGVVSAFSNVSYSLATAASGRLVFQLLNQDLQPIAASVPIDVGPGQGSIRLDASTTIPNGTTAVCPAAVLSSGTTTLATAYADECSDLPRVQ